MPAPQHTVSMKDLLTSGVHFGHQTRRWNPKMKQFIFGERGGIYIIDLQKTTVLIDEACDFLKKTAERGGSVLFVGTKKQCQETIQEQAERVGMPLRLQPLAGRPAHQLRHAEQAHQAHARAPSSLRGRLARPAPDA